MPSPVVVDAACHRQRVPPRPRHSALLRSRRTPLPAECGPNHDNGEFSHWSYFQGFAAQYIRSQYPQPWSPQAQKLAAFFFGVVSHYIAGETGGGGGGWW